MRTVQANTPRVRRAGGARGHDSHLGLVIFPMLGIIVAATSTHQQEFRGTISALLGCQFYISTLLPCFPEQQIQLVSFKQTRPSEPTNPAGPAVQPPPFAMLPTTAEDAEVVTWGFTRNQARMQDEQRSNSNASICNHKEQKVWLLTSMHVVWTLFFSWLLFRGKSLVLPIKWKRVKWICHEYQQLHEPWWQPYLNNSSHSGIRLIAISVVNSQGKENYL